MKTGRVFTLSLKPSWSSDKIVEFMNNNIGITIYAINHNRDIDEDTGELKEEHTHFYVEYETPRKVSTVANLFNVSENFVEVVNNKTSVLRYLTHLDDTDKAQYDASEVYTNSPIEYTLAIRKSTFTDREIYEYLLNGKGIELLDVVPSAKLRTIQAFLNYESSNSLLKELKCVREELSAVYQCVSNIDTAIETITEDIKQGLSVASENMTNALRTIAEQLRVANSARFNTAISSSKRGAR